MNRAYISSILAKTTFCLVLGFSFLVSHPGFSAPAIDNNAGTWTDSYNDQLGISASTNVQLNVFNGSVALMWGLTSGSMTTTEIKPPSYDAWETVCLQGTYSSTSQFTVDVLHGTNNAVLLTGLSMDANGCFDISSLPATLPSIKVRVNFIQGGSPVSPILNELEVSWNPITQLLLDKGTRFETVQAGGLFAWRIRYSVSYVEGLDVLIWDQLPTVANGGVTLSDTYTGQNDDPVLERIQPSKFGPGQYTATGTTINGQVIPPHSVYWLLPQVPEGTTEILRILMSVPNGSLDGNLIDNQAWIMATNAIMGATSDVVQVEVVSTPKPNLYKHVTGVVRERPDGTYDSIPGGVVTFHIEDPEGILDNNDYTGLGDETMYNSVIWDDMSDYISLIDTNFGTGGFVINGGGYYDPAYTPPGHTSAIPAIVWTNEPVLVPGATFHKSFSVRWDASANSNTVTNVACLDSERTTEVCDSVVIHILLNTGVGDGVFGKGDNITGSKSVCAAWCDDDWWDHIIAGETYTYHLLVDNDTFIDIEDVVFIDRIPDEVNFLSATLTEAASGTIYYTTSTAYPNPTNAPPWSNPATNSGSLGTIWTNYTASPRPIRRT